MKTVRFSDGVVSVLPLHDTPFGMAIHEADSYRVVGQVKESKWQERHPKTGISVTKKGWVWWYDEDHYGKVSGRERTKEAAVAAVLAAGGYEEAPPNAANPGIFPMAWE